MLVTVIVPVYNVENYLEKCVASIVSQTYQKLEIILVDDGSPDRSGEMCDELAKNDSRIKVIHQKNMGLSGARNSALDIMNGDAVTFVDSDDTIDLDMIENLVSDMNEYDADIVECQVHEIYADKIIENHYLSITKSYSPDEALLIDFSSRGGSIGAWAKLYRKKIFANHRFQIGRICEDEFAIIDSLSQANCVVIDHRAMYCYYRRNNSITTNVFKESTMDGIVSATENLMRVNREFPKALPGALFRFDWRYLWVFDRILLDSNWKDNPYFPKVRNHIRKNIIRILRCPYFTRNRKIGAILAFISPVLYRNVIKKIWAYKWN